MKVVDATMAIFYLDMALSQARQIKEFLEINASHSPGSSIDLQVARNNVESLERYLRSTHEIAFDPKELFPSIKDVI